MILSQQFYFYLCLFIIILGAANFFEGKYFNPFTPLRIWSFGWLIPIILSQVAWPLNLRWGNSLSLCIFLSVIFYLMGYFFIFFIPYSISQKRVLIDNTFKLNLVNYHLLNIIAKWLFLISIVSCIYIYIEAGGMPILNADEKIRISLQSREDYLWSIVLLSYISSFLSGIAYKNRRLYKSTFLLFVVMLILLFLSGWKGTFSAFVLYFFLPNILFVKKTKKSFLLIFLLVILAFFLITSLRLRENRFDIRLLLYYIFPNFLNLEKGIANCNTFHPGNIIFSGFLKLIYLPGVIFVPKDVVYTTWNVPTYLLFPYYDSGFFGVSLVSFLLGAYGRFFYHKICTNNSIFFLFLYSLYIHFVLIMHNNYLLESAAPYYWTITMVIAIIIIKSPYFLKLKKRNNSNSKSFR